MNRLVVNTFGTDTHNNFLTNVILECRVIGLFCRQLNGATLKVEVNIFALLFKRTCNEVHLRRAYEACNENVAGIVIQILRSIDLLNKTVLHNDYTCSHGHSLDLVVSNVYEGGTDSLMQLGKLGSHCSTELCIEVGKRLVQKEYFGVTDNSTAQRNTLLLTAGQSLGLSVKQMGYIKYTGSFLNAALDFFLRSLVQLKAEGHVFKHGHMRIKSIVLEHHCYFSVLRGNIIDQLVTDEKLALGNLLKSCDHTERGGFTATGRSDQNQKLLVLNLKIEVRHSGNAAGILLINVLKG